MNFSIVVPAYNEEAHYPSTLESIVAAAETLRSISGACVEILVVYNNKDNEMAWIGEDVDFYWALKRLAKREKGSVRLIRNPGCRRPPGGLTNGRYGRP